jgi:hypothetical protein
MGIRRNQGVDVQGGKKAFRESWGPSWGPNSRALVFFWGAVLRKKAVLDVVHRPRKAVHRPKSALAVSYALA